MEHIQSIECMNGEQLKALSDFISYLIDCGLPKPTDGVYSLCEVIHFIENSPIVGM